MWRNLGNVSICMAHLLRMICIIAALFLLSCTKIELAGYDGERLWIFKKPLPDQVERYYAVQEGDTLSDIGIKLGVPYTQLAKWNNISPPNYRIYPGQKLLFSAVSYRKSERTQSPIRPSQLQNAAVFSASRDTASLSFSTIPKVRSVPGWGWPFVSTSANVFRARYYQNGILLRGKDWKPVMAMADGEVVFRDQEVKHYGTLIIVRHQNGYFSTYAYCNEILVNKGQDVKRGQQIGKINYEKRNLYFEIRYQNWTINPYRLLVPRSVS